MQLINVHSLVIEEYHDADRPKYAILSHTWGKEEVSCQEMRSSEQSKSTKSGYLKVKKACEVAQSYGYDWLWADTACIDKSSSAELSEAINSMYRWYAEAEICLAYLEDIQNQSDLPRSRWFTRGWTLQELLAPREVEFFAGNWSFLGSKSLLALSLHKITKIDLPYLLGRPLCFASVAKRMSWASTRRTTRVEDIAYCLLGIFECHMALLYGEGANAFRRLQEEIIKTSTDQSIFAWGVSTEPPRHFDHLHHGYMEFAPTSWFAWHPMYFETSADVEPYPDWQPSEPYAMTNHGLYITLPFLENENSCILALLGCRTGTHPDSVLVVILTKDKTHNHQRARLSTEPFFIQRDSISRAIKRAVYISTYPPEHRILSSIQFLDLVLCQNSTNRLQLRLPLLRGTLTPSRDGIRSRQVELEPEIELEPERKKHARSESLSEFPLSVYSAAMQFDAPDGLRVYIYFRIKGFKKENTVRSTPYWQSCYCYVGPYNPCPTGELQLPQDVGLDLQKLLPEDDFQRFPLDNYRYVWLRVLDPNILEIDFAHLPEMKDIVEGARNHRLNEIFDTMRRVMTTGWAEGVLRDEHKVEDEKKLKDRQQNRSESIRKFRRAVHSVVLASRQRSALAINHNHGTPIAID